MLVSWSPQLQDLGRATQMNFCSLWHTCCKWLFHNEFGSVVGLWLMGTLENRISDFVDLLKSWIPWKSDSGNLSKGCLIIAVRNVMIVTFNSQYLIVGIIVGGQVFCAKCTANSIPAPSVEPNTVWEDWERVSVCNFCFKQWQQGITATDNGNSLAHSVIGPSPSATSLASIKSSGTCNSCSSMVGLTPHTTGPYEHVPYGSGPSPRKCAQVDPTTVEQGNVAAGRGTNPSADMLYAPQNEFGYYLDRYLSLCKQQRAQRRWWRPLQTAS